MAKNEGLRFARLLMVLSSLGPLFVLWALRGNPLFPDRLFVPACLAVVAVPYLLLWLRIRVAVSSGDRLQVTVGRAEDHRDHLLVYLFAMLLPFYSVNLGTWREFLAAQVGLVFIVFLFWHLNLHYMNVLFAVLGYRVFTVHSPDPGNGANPFDGNRRLALITKRLDVRPGDSIVAYRLSNSVLLEMDK